MVGWSFLIRTPELVEAGVREILRERLGPRWKIKKQKKQLIGSSLSLNPDIVVEPGFATADVKYKLSQADWERPDLYQAVAFAAGFETKNSAVIGFLSDGEGSARPSTVIFGDISIAYLGWDARPEVLPEEAAVELARQAARWLSGCSIPVASALKV